jgi:hypothetical protein
VDVDKFKKLGRAILTAESELQDALKEAYPTGMRVAVHLSSRQKTPSPATVYTTEPDIFGGKVVVELDKKRERSRYRFRRIGVADVEVLP